MTLGSFAVYATLLATGYLLYGEKALAGVLALLAVGSSYFIFRLWSRLGGLPEDLSKTHRLTTGG